MPNPNQRPGATIDSNVQVYTDAPIGWASVNDLGQDGTTGGGDAAPMMVTTLTDFETAVAGTDPAVIQLGASITGKTKIGSNKTILGMPGVVFTGHLGLDGSVNVILRDLTVVGYNCTDNADCQSGADAVTIDNKAHHIWVNHCDVSDGSDGNLDVASQADYVTISWTKFWYSGPRPGGHQFSNLIGSSDQATSDMGHLRVTWHHNWWADRVVERQPRARYGQIHLFNNLYTSPQGNYCIGLGVNANILVEDTVFDGVRDTVNTTGFSNAASVVAGFANLYVDAFPSPDVGTNVFTPPYDYTLQPADEVQAIVMANAGPHY
jgi:pectate lyase